jgi:hypothetical protein
MTADQPEPKAIAAPPKDLRFPPFRERFPWIGGDLQTSGDFLFIPSVTNRASRVERLEFPMNDGTDDVLLGALDHPHRPVTGAALAIVIHGLTGCEESKYVLRTSAGLLERGHPVLRLNLRGAGPSIGKARQQYHSGRSEDLRRVLEQLEATGRFQGYLPIGFSLGGNLVLKALGEFGRDFPIVAGCSVSAPIDLALTAKRFLDPRNTIYHRWLIERMKQEALQLPADAIPDAQREAVRNVRDIIAFDQALTAPRNGYVDAWEYYDRNAAERFMPDIEVPTLVIHALNDPWIPGAIYRRFDWSANPWLVPLLPERGGHVGFHEPGGGSWADRCLGLFLDAL